MNNSNSKTSEGDFIIAIDPASNGTVCMYKKNGRTFLYICSEKNERVSDYLSCVESLLKNYSLQPNLFEEGKVINVFDAELEAVFENPILLSDEECEKLVQNFLNAKRNENVYTIDGTLIK